VEIEAPEALQGDSNPEESKGRERLLHWRRQSKHLLVVMADDLDRAIVAGTLQVDGFANIHEAKSLVQAIDRCKKHLPDLLIVDALVGPHSAPEIVTKLRSIGVLEMSPVVVLLDRSDVKVKLASKALRLKHLIEKPVDYDGLLKGVLDKLLDLR
jgi:CheY-like chemotaxis protein